MVRELANYSKSSSHCRFCGRIQWTAIFKAPKESYRSSIGFGFVPPTAPKREFMYILFIALVDLSFHLQVGSWKMGIGGFVFSTSQIDYSTSFLIEWAKGIELSTSIALDKPLPPPLIADQANSYTQLIIL